jgi:hypothetical protein
MILQGVKGDDRGRVASCGGQRLQPPMAMLQEDQNVCFPFPRKMVECDTALLVQHSWQRRLAWQATKGCTSGTRITEQP